MNTISFPEPFVVHAKGIHTHTFICLHGRGDTGPSFGSLFYIAGSSSGFTLSELYGGMKFVWPTTKHRFSTRFLHHTTEWFNNISIEYPEKRSELQVEGLHEAVTFVHGLINAEIEAGIPPERIFLGGISQGCATALHVMLTFEKRLGAFVGMSGWLPFASAIHAIVVGAKEKVDSPDAAAVPSTLIKTVNFVRQNLSMRPLTLGSDTTSVPEALRTPVLLCHGDADETVNISLGRKIYGVLTDLGMDVTWREYEQYGHWYKVPDTIDDVIAFWAEKSDLLPS